MARFSRVEVLNAFLGTRIVPLFFNKEIEVATQVIDACVSSGARIIEFTNRGDHAFEVFTELEQTYARREPAVILGAGSIMDSPTAALYINMGANFIVAPYFNEEVARLCNRRKVAYLPGCASLAEIAKAEEAGVEIVKLFPCETVGGPEFVKAVLGPMPWSRIMPTGLSDISRERIIGWFKAGALCIGVGSKLIPGDIGKTRDFDGIAEKAAQLLMWIRETGG